ncbi:MAG: hypothetical protein ABJN72_03885 [Sulfitobacter sp.]
MPRYEYKVVPAPTKGIKGKGVRGAEARFSFALQELMNGMAGYGWEYQRSETLPSIERSGLTGSTTEWRNVLVFRRLREGDAQEFQPELLPAPEEGDDEDSHPIENEEKTDQSPLPDNGVEDAENHASVSPALSILARARSLTSVKPDAQEDAEEKDQGPKT